MDYIILYIRLYDIVHIILSTGYGQPDFAVISPISERNFEILDFH